MRNDLVFRFRDFDQPAELRRLRRFPFADNLRGCFKQTDEFIRRVWIILEYARFRLPHHLLSDRNHPIQFCFQRFQAYLIDPLFCLFDAIVHFLSNSFRLRDNLASRME